MTNAEMVMAFIAFILVGFTFGVVSSLSIGWVYGLLVMVVACIILAVYAGIVSIFERSKDGN